MAVDPDHARFEKQSDSLYRNLHRSDGKKGNGRTGQIACPFRSADWAAEPDTLHIRSNLAISLAQRRHEPLALMFLDLDDFKNVNDSLGHGIGDELLKQFADRLSTSGRKQDTISRLGGDEFVLILPGTDTDGAAYLAGRLLGIAVRQYNIERHEINLTVSIGIAMYPTDGTDFDTLWRSADAAMYRAKQTGRNDYCFFTTEMQARSAQTLQIDNALRRVLERNQFSLVYPPQLSLDTNRIVGFETLVR